MFELKLLTQSLLQPAQHRDTHIKLFRNMISVLVLHFRSTHRNLNFCSKRNWMQQTKGLMTMKVFNVESIRYMRPWIPLLCCVLPLSCFFFLRTPASQRVLKKLRNWAWTLSFLFLWLNVDYPLKWSTFSSDLET